MVCKWCHNPESQSYKVNFLHDKEKCTGCEKCVQVCKGKAVYVEDSIIKRDANCCELCGECIDWCLTSSRELVGDSYEVKELVKIIEKDTMFYDESGGGVTLSGGEVMCQNMDYVEQIIDACNRKGIHVAVDTCGYAPKENYERIYKKVDVFLYDIKLVNEEKHIEFTGRSNDKIIENLKFLSSVGANINIRIPLITGVNVSNDNKEVLDMIDLLKDLKIAFVNLLPYHNIMTNKYAKLDIEYEGNDFEKPSDEKLEEIKAIFEENNFKVKIGG